MKALIVIIFTVLIVTLASMTTNAQVGVANDAPSWVNIELDTQSDYFHILLTIRDLNGWMDVYSVNVTIYDAYDSLLSKVTYRQYNDPSSATPAIQWVEIEGNYLLRDYSNWQYISIPPWDSMASAEVGLNITFTFTPFLGDNIQIECIDKQMASCVYVGPFPQYDDNDDLPNEWEMTHFGDLTETETNDYDNDGYNNGQEFQDGTDPTDPTDYKEETGGGLPGFELWTIAVALIISLVVKTRFQER